MIVNLKDNYYKITSSDLKHIMAGMNVSHNINEPFKTIIDQIETTVDFSDAGKVPYMTEQVVNTS